ncbi:MAG: L-lactate permease [Clostridiaceae bacterium]|nr:L-lactate permease [Clostridiaceae bacterium]
MGQVGSLLLTLLPIVVILCMLIVWKKPADISGIVGWIIISAVAVLFFKTSLEVVLRSTLAGLIKSFAVSLIVLTSLFQMAFMEKTGALKRVIIFIKTISSENRAVQIMMLNIGFGTLMVAVGATPVSLLPPILLAMGYSTYVAIALPAIGYDSLCTYALLGAPIVVFVGAAKDFFGYDISLTDAGKIFYMFLPIVSTLIGFCMLWIVDKWNGIKKGYLPCLISGAVIGIVSYFTNRVENLVALTGILSGIAVIIAMVIYLVVTGKKVIDRSILTKEEIEYEKKFPLWKALLPWTMLIVLILIINLPKPVFDFFYANPFMKLTINGIAANGKGIDTRALWNAYTWILVSVLLSIPFLRPTAAQIKDTVKTWWKRAPRPVFSAAIFFAIGEIMNMSGYDMVAKEQAADSMVKVLADYSSQMFQNAYGTVVSFIGLFGGFITGSEASTIGMFVRYTMTTGKNLNFGQNGIILLAAALAFGGGLASVISPAKLQNAAASIDKLGEENKVIRIAFVFSVILTLVTSIFVTILLNTGIVK